MKNKCRWWQMDSVESEYWETDCGEVFEFIENTPEEIGFKFCCCFCGGKLKQERYEDNSI